MLAKVVVKAAFTLTAAGAGAGAAHAVTGQPVGSHRPGVHARPGAPQSPLNLPTDMGRLAEAAKRARAEYGVPVSVAMGQAILESGAGRSGLARDYNNLYGIKCAGGGAGPIAVRCVGLRTGEHLGGRDVTVTAPFRVYRSPEDSVRDWARLIATSPRYAPAMRVRADPGAFLAAVRTCGYATDPGYVGKVQAVISQYHLHQYDR